MREDELATRQSLCAGGPTTFEQAFVAFREASDAHIRACNISGKKGEAEVRRALDLLGTTGKNLLSAPGEGIAKALALLRIYHSAAYNPCQWFDPPEPLDVEAECQNRNLDFDTLDRMFLEEAIRCLEASQPNPQCPPKQTSDPVDSASPCASSPGTESKRATGKWVHRSPAEIQADFRKARRDYAEIIADIGHAYDAGNHDAIPEIEKRFHPVDIRRFNLSSEAWSRPIKTAADIPLLAELVIADFDCETHGVMMDLDSEHFHEKATARLVYWLAKIFDIPITFEPMSQADRALAEAIMFERAMAHNGIYRDLE